MKGDEEEVLAGSSLLDHPIEFICARKDSAAMETKLEGRMRDRYWYGRCARCVDDFFERINSWAWKLVENSKKKTPPDCLLNSGCVRNAHAPFLISSPSLVLVFFF